jgi:molybdopterin converting factor subunit 1
VEVGSIALHGHGDSCPVGAQTRRTPMSCTVRTLFFAAYRDLVGASEMEVEVAEGATVRDLVVELRGRGEPFLRLPEDPAIAVNRTYAGAGEPLRSGDEVAFIPPVAGG